MPELPEVETLRRALLPLVVNKTCTALKFYRKDIRFPIPQATLRNQFANQVVSKIQRNGKYLLLQVPEGAMLLHLGMSGHVSLQTSMTPREKHTHAIFCFGSKTCLHFVDPRRFGCILWVPQSGKHPLLDKMGPDPFSPDANAKALKGRAKNCRSPIKTFIKDTKRKAGRITLAQWDHLISCIRSTLEDSISAGGTTLRDFFDPSGAAGYYAVQLSAYGKEGEPCQKCKTPISRMVHSGRSTFFCKICQPA